MTSCPATDSAKTKSDILEKIDATLLEAELHRLKSDILSMEKASSMRSRFSFQEIGNQDHLVNHYTGLPSGKEFKILFGLCSRFEIHYSSGWRVQQLSMEDQLLVTLMKLRCNFSTIDLSVRFQVSHSTISNIFRTWVSVLHHVLHEGILPSKPPSLAKNKTSLPCSFSTFSSCRIILDCTEVEIAVPSKFDAKSWTYSHYKHRNTFKALVGVSPNGAVTFASKLYAGSTSDKEIVRHSCIMEKMSPGDMIMADKGFLIQDLLPPGVSLNLPPFLETAQFTPAQAKMTVRIARARIHIERAIRRIKLYAILSRIPHKHRSIASEIFKVCAMLTNLMNPLIREVEEVDIVSCQGSGPNASAETYGAPMDDPNVSGPTIMSLSSSTVLSANVPVFFLPASLCQSRIDGRQGSNACTVIACLHAQKILSFSSGHLRLSNVCEATACSFVDSIREGNALYDGAGLRGALLAVYEALDLLPEKHLKPMANCDFGVRNAEQLLAKLQWAKTSSKSSANVVTAALVQTPFTILLAFFPDGKVIVFDSHAHEEHGAMIAYLPDENSTTVSLLSSLVGHFQDAHLCFLALQGHK